MTHNDKGATQVATNSPAALLPCPFCGSEDVLCERADFSSAYILCNNCLARGPEALQESDDEETPGEASARKAWNRRASTAPAASESRGSVPDGWRLEQSDDGRTIWVCGRGHRIGVEFGDPLWMLFRAFTAPTPPAVASGEPTAEQWKCAWELEQGDSVFSAMTFERIEQRARELARSAAAKVEG